MLHMSLINLFFTKIFSAIKKMQAKDLFCRRAKVLNLGFALFHKYIIGKNNFIQVGKGAILNRVEIRIVGNNNKIIFGDKCSVGKKCSFWLEGNNIVVRIGENSSFTHNVHFCAQEDASIIQCGKNCMFSNSIIVRTSDSHPIYDLVSLERINQAKPVVIGDNVWVAPGARILKGAIIGDGSVIGSNTIVSNEIPSNVLAVGMPARVVKQNIYWTREKIF